MQAPARRVEPEEFVYSPQRLRGVVAEFFVANFHILLGPQMLFGDPTYIADRFDPLMSELIR